jgi:hypothetical protein
MGAFATLKRRFRAWRLARKSPSDVFSSFYRKNHWRDAESRSGAGSNLAATAFLRPQLPPLLAELGVQSLLDLPCGDFHWMRHVDLGIARYTGGDIVPSMIAANQAAFAGPGISFEVIDLITGPIPRHDLILTRDCLVHLSTEHIMASLRNIKASGATWLLTTTFPTTGTNVQIVTGQWRAIDLQKPPFNFGPPQRLIVEGAADLHGQRADKMLGLWRVEDLPDFEPLP